MEGDAVQPQDNPDLQRIIDRIPAGWRNSIDVGPGWYPIVIELDQQLAALFPDYEVNQVKEKFGGLRYYIDGVDYDVARVLIREAERKAIETCEVCGKPARTMRRGYWYKTVCPTCRPDYEPIEED